MSVDLLPDIVLAHYMLLFLLNRHLQQIDEAKGKASEAHGALKFVIIYRCINYYSLYWTYCSVYNKY